MTKLSGVFPVIPTPFTPANALDEAALLRLVDWALDCGVDGVVFPGMASEVETLTPEERARLVAALGRRIGPRVPFIVGASDPDPVKSAARVREGKAAGAVAAMIMAPHGLGADVAKHVAFYETVAREAALPLMLQNAPPPNGAGLGPAQVAAIVRAVPAIRTVKEETMPCGQHVTRIRAEVDPGVAVFGGAGARFLMDELARGAAGTMPALEIADVHVAMMAAWRKQDHGAARRLYTASLPLLVFQMIFRVRATKEVLRRRGLLAQTGARAAGPKLDDGDHAELRALLADARAIFTRDVPDLS